MSLSRATAFIACALSTGANAHTERQHGTHEHGAAHLTISQDGRQLAIEFESPWYNLVGFGHAPADEIQQETVDTALAAIEDGERLFAPGKGCALLEVTLESSMARPGEHGHGETHAAGHVVHDHDEAHGADGHSDLRASYSFECDTMPTVLNAHPGMYFPRIESIEVQMAGPGGQDAQRLDADDTSISLERIQ
ncbi:MAG: hypothetical protein CSB44_12220 [Gammaproteobacteria bacterium]|nr:MAG: hypothetical protein CSB44_12220 [Gammaproteobacteria bacterium]